jgi:hypothetical protein
MVEITLCLGLDNTQEPPKPIMKQLEWPVVPRRGDQFLVDTRGYDVLAITHDVATGAILVKCLPWAVPSQEEQNG